ncbi:MAG: UDP-2,3-diacylglucosamine diphosphatase [Muribaculaceae bacterium]|nr:UDP-2,3-diacylglucosamine diphosphatase [Muribaculaceae bacterium]
MKKAYFLSDAHLGARYITDKREHEGRLVAFLDSIKDDAAELFLMGDILDYWYEYKYVVPRGHIRFLGKLAELADAGVKIYWFTGNHDVWLFDYLATEVGLKVLKGNTMMEILGHQFLLSHGDDVGYQRPMYRFTRWCFYNPVCQWLYASVHPRWTYTIATGWSNNNRVTRPQADEERLKQVCSKRLEAFCNEHAAEHPEVQHYVFGHIHLAQHLTLNGDRTMTILGDWIDQYTYATFDGKEITLHKFDVK